MKKFLKVFLLCMAVLTVLTVAVSAADYELYADTNSDRIIVRFPWKSDEKDFDAMAAINEIIEEKRK